MKEMKYSGVAWIGDIPSDWGLIPTKRVFTGHKDIAGDRWETMNRLALTLNGVVQRSKEDVDGLQPEKFDTYQVLRKNELVFKLIDLQNISTSRVGLSPYDGIVSPAYLILSNGCKDNRFYYHWFFSMYLNCVFNNMGDNGVRSNLNMKDLLNIPLPNLSENQRTKIADYIDQKCSEIDSLISLQDDMITKLQEYKQSVITEAVTRGLDPSVPMKDSGIEWVGMIPEHWRICKIKNVINGIADGTHGTYERTEEGEYLLSAKNISEQGIIISSIDSKISISDYLQIVGNSYPQKGDVLLCCVGSIGKCCIFKEEKPLAFQRSVAMLRVNGLMYNQYLLYLLRSHIMLNQYKMYERKSAQSGIYMGLIKELQLPFISLEEQHQIADFLDRKCTEIDSLIDIKKQKIEALKEYKKSLIYECVTGKKEIA